MWTLAHRLSHNGMIELVEATRSWIVTREKAASVAAYALSNSACNGHNAVCDLSPSGQRRMRSIGCTVLTTSRIVT